MTPTVIGIFMAVVFVALAGFDIYLSHDARDKNTFSARFRALGRWWTPARLLIVFTLGLLSGHLFWTPQDVHDVGGKPCPSETAAPDAGK